MALPKSVTAQAEAANRLVQQQIADDGEVATETTEAQAPEQESPATEPQVQESEPKIQAKEPSKEEAPKDPPKAKDEDTEYWRNRYSVLEGKYKAEVPRLHQQLKEAVAAKGRLEAEIENIKADFKRLSDLHDEDDLQDILSSTPRKDVEQEAQRAQQMEELRQAQEELKAEREARFFADLDRVVPDWKAINDSPGFQQWLGEVDPLSGHVRDDLLKAAANALNLGRTAEFFKRWQSQTQTTQERNASRVKELESEALPKNSVPAPKPKTTADGIPTEFTAAEIEKFYNDKTLGRIRPEEAKRIEQAIFRAMQEGRVT